MRNKFAIVAVLALACVPLRAGIIIEDLGNAPPPSKLGPYDVGPFPIDTRPITNPSPHPGNWIVEPPVSSVASPNGGEIGFGGMADHGRIWGTTLDNYATTSLTMPDNTHAFYLSVIGTGGYYRFGIYTTGADSLSSINATLLGWYNDVFELTVTDQKGSTVKLDKLDAFISDPHDWYVLPSLSSLGGFGIEKLPDDSHGTLALAGLSIAGACFAARKRR